MKQPYDYKYKKEEISMTDRELINLAKEASKNAYVPYSRFPVGAALECRGGIVFTGCNIENAALGSTICAERTAACKAISEGHRDFIRIAVYGEGQNYCYPCGACRQFLAEFAPEMEVLSAKKDRYVSNKLSELLPHTFNF
jgi:cytidine deaminase